MNVFLSQASSDRRVARQVADALEAAGLSVWYGGEIMPGEDAFRRVSEELARADAMVVLVTPDGSRSEWVQRELEYALSTEKYRRKIFPVLAGWPSEGERDYPWILKRFKTFIVPATGEGGALTELAATLKQAH